MAETVDLGLIVQVVGIMLGIGVPAIFGAVKWAINGSQRTILDRLDRVENKVDEVMKSTTTNAIQIAVLKAQTKTTV